jgi:hypothetical protein
VARSEKWIARSKYNFTNKYRNFRSFKSLTPPLDMLDKTQLISDLSETQWRVNGKHNLATSLNVKESKVALLYNPRFFQFFIIHELHFAMPEDQLITAHYGHFRPPTLTNWTISIF